MKMNMITDRLFPPLPLSFSLPNILRVLISSFLTRERWDHSRAGDVPGAPQGDQSSEIEEEGDKNTEISCLYLRESSMAHSVPFGKDFVIEQIYWLRPGEDPKTTEVSIFCSVNFIRDCGLLTGKIFRSSVNTQRGITKIWFDIAKKTLQGSL